MTNPLLAPFLNSEGKATLWPAKKPKQELLLQYLVTKFESNRAYSEKEVNEVLNAWHIFNDWSLLRRELYDKGYFNRDNDGTNYRLAKDFKNQFDLLCEEILKIEKPDNRQFVIGISGFGGSGKSTLAEKLKNVLNDTQVVSMDAFGIDRLSMRSEDWSSFDRNRVVAQVLQPAQDGESIIYDEYDWDQNKITGKLSVQPSRYLIVEGCSCLHPDLLPYYDFTVWIDCPLEVATERGMERDKKWGYNSEKEWRNIWMPNERDFLEKYHPDKISDYTYIYTK